MPELMIYSPENSRSAKEYAEFLRLVRRGVTRVEGETVEVVPSPAFTAEEREELVDYFVRSATDSLSNAIARRRAHIRTRAVKSDDDDTEEQKSAS